MALGLAVWNALLVMEAARTEQPKEATDEGDDTRSLSRLVPVELWQQLRNRERSGGL
jgi:hypothetical protein